MNRVLAILATGLFCSAAVSTGWAADVDPFAIPDFVSGHATWNSGDGAPGTAATELHFVPGELSTPVTYDIAHPYVANADAFRRPPTARIADLNNPILQPWTKAVMKAANDDVLKTGRFPFTAEQRCWPGGVPGLLLFPGTYSYLQTKNQVWFINERDHQIRRIYLNQPHQANPGYSWYGDEIGHYEHGDTLAIDTIGLDDKGPVDNYRTPHTRQLHVTETQQLDPGRSRIFMNISVNDPGAFTRPWKAWKVFVKARMPADWTEVICAENNPDYFDEKPTPMPTAFKLDF